VVSWDQAIRGKLIETLRHFFLRREIKTTLDWLVNSNFKDNIRTGFSFFFLGIVSLALILSLELYKRVARHITKKYFAMN
jgi:hypothetical protein